MPGEALGPTDRVLYRVAAGTGLRQGELIALRWIDVDWAASLVRVRRSITRGRLGAPKSRWASRAVPLSDRLAGELERHVQRSLYQSDTRSATADGTSLSIKTDSRELQWSDLKPESRASEIARHLATRAGGGGTATTTGAGVASDLPLKSIGCIVLGGYGTGFAEGQECVLDAWTVDCPIRPEGLGDILSFAWDSLEAFEIAGRGEIESGGRFIGGGFGLTGAAAGIIASSLLNSLTARSSVETLLNLEGADWQLVLFHEEESPDALRLSLAEPLATHRRARSADTSSHAPDLPTQLRQLSELHEQGQLGSTEFDAAAPGRLIGPPRATGRTRSFLTLHGAKPPSPDQGGAARLL